METLLITDIPTPHRERIADMVYKTLRRAIVRHELKPGMHLSVPALAEQFRVSRSPVREAVQRAVREGLATELPHRGAFVTEFKAPELEPLYQVRAALEGLAARLAATRVNDTDLQHLEQLLNAQAQALGDDDIERHVDADIGFHAALLRAARNPILHEMLDQVYGRIRSAMLGRASPTGPQQALEDHRAIFKAVASGDADAAASAAEKHVSRALKRFAKAHGEVTIPPTAKQDASAPMHAIEAEDS